MVKILIVEDSIFSQKVMATLLKKYIDNVEISFACDGKEGFFKYKELKPHYVFLDLLMPKVNGLELTKLLKEYDKEVKIFVVTADVQDAVRKEMEVLNIMAFINKPFNDEKAQKVCKMIKDGKNERY